MYTAQKAQLTSLFWAGVQAVAPDSAILRHLHLENDVLYVGKSMCSLAQRHIVVLGAGKGAAPMAAAVENVFGSRIRDGLVVVKSGHTLPLQRIHLYEASHPVPDAAGVAATQALLTMAEQTTSADMVICVLTGGASALTPAPVAPITLQDLQTTTSLLLECGATISEINAIRKHISCIHGGLLARVCQPSAVLSVIVSDVVGDRLDVIASGPTAPDMTTFADCTQIVQKFSLEGRLPARVMQRLAAGVAKDINETPKKDDPLFANVRNILVATNKQALEAAASAAREQGMHTEILTDSLQGEARERAQWIADIALRRAASMHTGDAPVCLLAGGETTVTLSGQGKGGRNQEMALAATISLQGQARITALFAGTDGTDGPTDAAGGFATADSYSRLQGFGQPEQFLQAHDSYTALSLSEDIFKTGPTLTNVMDMALVIIEPPR